jgi:hypothetical protein
MENEIKFANKKAEEIYNKINAYRIRMDNIKQKDIIQIEKEHKKSALMSRKKKDLVDLIMCLEHNNNVLHDTINRQVENFKVLLSENQIKDIALLEKCNICGANITLMASINVETNKIMLVKRCLSCGSYPLVEVADITDINKQQ